MTAFGKHEDPPAPAEQHGDTASSFHSEWKAHVGANVRDMRAAWGETSDRDRILLKLGILAIVLESSNYIARWLMRTVSTTANKCAWPPLMDLANEEFSPIHEVLQYLSALSTGRLSRLELLWHVTSDSYDDWCSRREDEAILFRRVLMVYTCWLCARLHTRYTEDLPWSAARWVDHRTPEEQRDRERTAFVNMSFCCKDDGFSQRVHTKAPTLEALKTPQMEGAVGELSKRKVTIAHVEF